MIQYTDIVNAVVVYVAMHNDQVSFQDCVDATMRYYSNSDGSALNSIAIGRIATEAWEFVKEVFEETDIIEV